MDAPKPKQILSFEEAMNRATKNQNFSPNNANKSNISQY